MILLFQESTLFYTFMKCKRLEIFSVLEGLKARNMRIFTPRLFRGVFPVAPTRIKYFLETATKKGRIVRLKKGLYAVKTPLPSEEEIANVLYQPSYISFEYALMKHGILPEMVYAVTSATTKPTRLFTVGGLGYSYLTIGERAFIGYTLQNENVSGETRSVLFAEPEKALADYLYFVALGRKTLNDRLILERLDKKKIIQYANLFNNRKLVSLIDSLYA